MARKILHNKSYVYHLLLFSLFLLTTKANAQIGIGTTSPDSSSVIDLRSSTRGILIPRMASLQRQAINLPAKGLLVFDNDSSYFFYYNGAAWKSLKNVTQSSISAGPGVYVSGTGAICAQMGTAEWNANKLQSYLISPKTPTNNQVLKWNSGLNEWTPATDTGGAGYSAGTGMSLNGNIFSAQTATAQWNASQVQGNNISPKAPTNNQVMKWNSGLNEWTPATDTSITYTGGTGISVSGTTINAQNTTAQWNANQIEGKNISPKAPTNNQVLKWNSGLSEWTPATDTSGSGSSSWTISGNNIYNNNTSNVGIGKSSPAYQLDVKGPVNADSVMIGGYTLFNTKGTSNLLIGSKAGNNNSGTGNLFVGASAGISNTANNNTFIGNSAGYNNTSGGGNQFEGYYAGFDNTTGANNYFSGQQAGYSNTTGGYNDFVGNNAGMKNTTGSNNIFLGMQAGYDNTTGARNTYEGYAAGYNNITGSQNEISGYQADNNGTSFSYDVIHGYQSGYNNNGNYNTFAGYNSGYTNTTGVGNTFYGNYSGFGYTGTHNTFIGDSADANTASLTNATAIGYNAKVGQSNSIVLGNGSANVGIGNPTPAASAVLDLTSTTQGLLAPRMTTTQRKAISSPATGLMVFDNTLDSFYFYNGTKWTNFAGAASSSSSSSGSNWSTTGNSGMGSGNFIGTTDNNALYIKEDNTQVGVFQPNSMSLGNGSTINNATNCYAIGSSASIGYNKKYSFAIGDGANISSDSSFAFGDNAAVNNYNSFAIGNNAAANGTTTIAIGSKASAGYSITGALAMGQSAAVASDSAYAIGNNAQANLKNSFAIGTNAASNSINSLAIGKNSSVGWSITDGIALGDNANATSNNSIAIGSSASSSAKTQTNGANSIAIGTTAIANSASSIAIGRKANVGWSLTTSMAIGDSAINNASTSVAIGADANIGYNSEDVALGVGASVSGTNSVAIGYNAKVTTNNAIVLGNGANVGIGTSSPNSTALLDLTSTTQGFLAPRMTTTQRTAISSPATGLMVFDNTLDSLYLYNGTKWANVDAPTVGASPWTTNGNNIYNSNTANVGIGKSNPYHGLDAKKAINSDSAYMITGVQILSTKGTSNVFTGQGAGKSNTSGAHNNFVGDSAGYKNTSGSYNNFDGYEAGFSTTTGSQNTASGYHAGYTNTTGTNNTFIGDSADASAGAFTNATAIGYHATVGESNAIVLGSGANIGIGTSTPGNRLEIYSGTGGVSGLRMREMPTGSILFMNSSGDVAENNNNLYFDATNYRLSVGAGQSPNSTITSGGSFATGISTKTASYSASVNDHTILCNGSSAMTITLPAVSGCTGRIYVIKNIASGAAVTVQGNSGTEYIDGSSTYKLASQYNAVTIQSDGSSWWVLNHN